MAIGNQASYHIDNKIDVKQDYAIRFHYDLVYWEEARECRTLEEPYQPHPVLGHQ